MYHDPSPWAPGTTALPQALGLQTFSGHDFALRYPANASIADIICSMSKSTSSWMYINPTFGMTLRQPTGAARPGV